MYTGINGPKYNIGGGGPADDMYRFKEESSLIVTDSCVQGKKKHKKRQKLKNQKNRPGKKSQGRTIITDGTGTTKRVINEELDQLNQISIGRLDV